MKQSLRVLLVEDSQDDEFLIRRELEKANYVLELLRIESAEQMREALAKKNWDLIVSDYQLPGFSGLEALAIYRESGLDVPFIVLSGMIGEDLAVEMMRQGAHDYLMKDALKRLPMAVERELRESGSRQSKRAADEEVRLLSRYYQLLSQTNQAIVRILDPKALLSIVASIAVHVGGFSWAGFGRWENEEWKVETGFGEGDAERILLQLAPKPFPFLPIIKTVSVDDGVDAVSALFPIRVQGRPWGGIAVCTKNTVPFTEDETKLLIALSADVAFALEARFEAQFRRELDRQLSRERERLALTLENVVDGIVALDSEGKVAFLNHNSETLLGLTPGTGESIFLADFLPKDALEANHSLRTLPFVNKKGKAFPLEIAVTEVSDGRGSGLSRVVLLRDITEQEKMEERLRQSEKMESIGLLAGGIAHDFNNLLTGIFGFLQLAKMNAQEPDKVEMYLDRALNPFNRARNLTQQLLTFAKGGQPLKKRLNLADMVKSLTEFTLSGSTILVERQQEPNLSDAQGNEAQIGQVFENLILNAKQAMPNGGSLKISLSNKWNYERSDLHLPKGNYVVAEVRDSGPGIPADLQRKIFDPFFTTKKEGTGLGLSICFSVVRKHGGAIEVESTPGKGSVFRVFLPSLESDASTTPGSASPASKGQGVVYFLDDEEYARSIAASMLEKLGYEVILFEKGHDLEIAYQKQKTNGGRVDFVILDLTIKGGPGGVEVLKNLKALDPEVLAIASSGYSNESALAEPSKFGFAASLPKPFSMEELSEVLQRAGR